MSTRIKLLEELIRGFKEEMDHMISTQEHVTSPEYFESLEDRMDEAKLELWRERRIKGI